MPQNAQPIYDAFGKILSLCLQASAAALLLSLLIAAIAALSTDRKFWASLIFVMPFGWLGTVSGLIAGSTKEAIVGALLTGMLTVVGALLSYTFSKEAQLEWRKLLPFAVILLSMGALVGLSIGQINRSEYEAYERNYARWLLQYEKADLPAIAVRIRYRDCLARVSVDPKQPTPEARASCLPILVTGK
jgi:hypothetical protein